MSPASAGSGARRAGSSPARPRGASHSTASSPAPNTNWRYSASPASSSGNSPTSTAPASGPTVLPAPPSITTSRNKMDCENGNEDGAMKPVSPACSPPARPAAPAASTKAAVRTGSARMPTLRAAAGAVATTAIASPSGERRSQSNPASPAAQHRHASTAVPFTPNGPGMPAMPDAPPVSPRHSVLAASTMKPNAIVTIARYGPLTRSAGSDSRAATAKATAVATGHASRNGHPATVVSTPTP